MEDLMEFTSSCPKCKGQMEQGFIVDYGKRDYISEWSQGPPDLTSLSRVAKVKKPREITTYRCSGCGFLESYAR
ncbi:hypothetical protein BH10CYA1_BH10CYA1_64760 [soil metagenome]